MEEVGRGTFGRVLECNDKKTTKKVAVKVCDGEWHRPAPENNLAF